MAEITVEILNREACTLVAFTSAAMHFDDAVSTVLIHTAAVRGSAD
jgi:hypothetical protein